MAKATSPTRKPNKLDIENMSQRDIDILTLDTKEVMKKYKLQKQGVYDRKFAVNTKLRAAGLTLDQVLNKTAKAEPVSKNSESAKKSPKKAVTRKEKTGNAGIQREEEISNNREVMVVNKQVPVIMKPIEINFENFSIKLNGVPKKIAVNPDTNAIEIDL